MKKLIQETNASLIAEQSILFPTDTIWGIGGDATSEKVVSAIYKLKKRVFSKALLCLMQDLDMVRRYFKCIPHQALDLFEDVRPTTVILDQPQGIAHNMVAADQSLAVRIPKDEFCQYLLATFGKPIIATSANTSGNPNPTHFSEIESCILEGVDYIVPLKKDLEMKQPSRIIKVDLKGNLTVIRS